MRIKKIEEGADLMMNRSFSKFYDAFSDMVIFLEVLSNGKNIPDYVKEKAKEILKDAKEARKLVLQW